MYKPIAILLVALAAIDFSESRGGRCQSNNSPYCKLFGDDHTMCKYCGVDTDTCGKLDGSGITDEDKKVLLDKHNELRRKVAKGQESRGATGPQPGAANMNELVWDDEVAEIAQMWANQCIWGHDSSDRRKLKDGMSCGQNMATMSMYIPDPNMEIDKSSFLEQRVQRWYDEVKYFPKEGVKSFPGTSNKGQMIGHYTQLVWGTVTKLGCGYTRQRVDGGMTKLSEVLVCNYCEGGNMFWNGKGAEIYKAGSAAKQCPKERPTPNDGLCSK